MPLHLTPLHHAEPERIEALLDLAFGTDRKERTAYRLRAGSNWVPRLSFAAWRGEELIGTLQSWPVTLRSSAADHDLIMVGPVAVLPAEQGQGVGTALMDALVQAADREGDQAMMMIGDPDYYGRWGFVADRTDGWRIDGPYERHRLLARLGRPLPSGLLTPVRHAEALPAL